VGDAVLLGGLYRDQLVLGIAREITINPADRLLAGVPDRVGHPPRHEGEAACGDRELAIPELERGRS
jgi:hypothetical protein